MDDVLSRAAELGRAIRDTPKYRALREAGKSPSAIARELGSDTETVRGWIEEPSAKGGVARPKRER